MSNMKSRHTKKLINRTARALGMLLPYGPRGWVMLIFALVAFGRAADYLRPARAGSAPFLLREISAVVPVCVWGVAWGITGLVLLVWAFRQRHGMALGILAGISLIWAFVYMMTAALGVGGDDSIRAWQGALSFLLFFVIVVALAKMINPARRSRRIIE